MTPVAFSSLVRQALVHGPALATKYPHAWLVWEPGARVVVPSPIPLTTVVPTEGGPREGDPLCLPLVQRAPGQPLRLGRAPGNELLIDDRTVSRFHLELWPEAGGGWLVTIPAESHAVTLVRNLSLQVGEKMHLVDGCAVLCGGVTFTFHTAEKLVARVLARMQHLREGR